MHTPLQTLLGILRLPLHTDMLLLAGASSAQTFYNPIVAAGQDPSIVLNASANTIRFTKGTHHAELDSIELHK